MLSARDLEEAAVVVERVELVAVEEAARRAVTHEGVVVPAVPQALHDVEVFVGDLVAQFVIGMHLAEILRGAFERRRHDVPARAPAADRIERRELARDRERLAVRRRDRARGSIFVATASADSTVSGSKRFRKCGIDFVDVQAVGDERERDAGGFRLARDADREVEVDARVRRVARVPPCIHVAACALQHQAEGNRSSGRHGSVTRSGQGKGAVGREGRLQRRGRQRAAEPFDRCEPRRVVGHRRIDHERIDVEPPAQCIERAVDALGRIGQHRRAQLVDPVVGRAALPREFGGRLRAGEIEALAARELQLEDLQRPDQLLGRVARRRGHRVQRNQRPGAARAAVRVQRAFEVRVVAVEVPRVAEAPAIARGERAAVRRAAEQDAFGACGGTGSATAPASG